VGGEFLIWQCIGERVLLLLLTELNRRSISEASSLSESRSSVWKVDPRTFSCESCSKVCIDVDPLSIKSPLTNGGGIELSSALGQLERYKIFTILQTILPKSAFKAVTELDDYVAELSKKRQARGHIKDGSDMFNYLLENKGDDVFSQKEYEGNALTLLFAGADTTATVMIFGSYLLCKNPEVAKQARIEVRSAFRHSSEINATNVNELKYMIAILSETMRLYPPGPSGLARHIVNKAGQMVAGCYVPYNVSTLFPMRA